MKPFALFTLLLLLAMSCRRKDDDLSGMNTVEVRLSLKNDVTGPGTAEPLAQTTVYVNRGSSTLSYLFSATSDDNGICRFELLKPDTGYIFFAKRTVDNLLFSGNTTANGNDGSVDVSLLADGTTQNGFVVECEDVNGDPFSGLTVCVFTSAILAAGNSCSAAVFNGTTDAYGRFAKWNIGDGDYFVRVKNEALFVDIIDTVHVGANGFTRAILQVPTASGNGFVLRCVDAEQAGVPGINSCVFLSAALAGQEDCTFSTFQGATDAYGNYAKANIPPGPYYLRIYHDSIPVELVDTILVLPQGITRDTVQVIP